MLQGLWKQVVGAAGGETAEAGPGAGFVLGGERVKLEGCLRRRKMSFASGRAVTSPALSCSELMSPPWKGKC